MDLEIQRKKEIRGACFRVVAFFDLFDYALTENDLWQFLPVECRLEEMLVALREERILQASFIARSQGHYYLSGREELLELKTKRYNCTNKKIRRARRVAKLFSLIPWIKMIAVSNNIGNNNLKKDGDIDLFIITQKNRVWISRLLCVLTIKLLNLRPQEGDIKDKICLSFFISEDHLNIRKYMNRDKDIYYIYWLAGLVPIYDPDKVYEKFISANEWLKSFLPNWAPYQALDKRLVKPIFKEIYNETMDFLFGGLEKNLRNWQIRRLPEVVRGKMNMDNEVVVNEQVVKLHTNDRREKIYKAYINKLGLIGL